MQFVVVTLMPTMYDLVRASGVIGRALDQGVASLNVVNLREFSEDRHGTIDDRPYGGGPGMVLKAEPMLRAVAAAKNQVGETVPVVHFSPRGQPLTQADVSRWATDYKAMIMLASRFEGLDQRVIDQAVDIEVSVGDFVVSGGDLPVMMAMDAAIRQLPGALGDESSKNDESFIDGLLEYPQYTRPETVGGVSVPEILMSGNHQQIQRWRQEQALITTKLRRPDMIERRDLSDQEAEILKSHGSQVRQQTEEEQ